MPSKLFVSGQDSRSDNNDEVGLLLMRAKCDVGEVEEVLCGWPWSGSADIMLCNKGYLVAIGGLRKLSGYPSYIIK